MKKVMVRAWEIAREAVNKFGGKVKEFFQQALIMAWQEVKEVKFNKVVANRNGIKELSEKFVAEMNMRFEKALESGAFTVEVANEKTAILNKFFATQSYKTVKAMMNDGNTKTKYALILRDFAN